MTRVQESPNYINHITFVFDASSSMSLRARDLVRVADQQVAYLAQRSKDLDQETRVTIYVFSGKGTVKCVVYDKDVLRLPSIASYYRPRGMTALIDATVMALNDMDLIPEKYGDHAHLLYVFTDGQENDSINRHTALAERIQYLANNRTVAVLVPDQRGVFEAKRFGFPAQNIAIWDATTAEGINEAGSVVREATNRFMESRVQGVRSSRSIFSTDSSAVNSQTIQAADLKPLPPSTYVLVPVDREGPIKEFVERCGYPYRVGTAYYQLSKTENIQPQKGVAIVRKNSGEAYMGTEARGLLGLPSMQVRVKPDYNPEFDVFIQSTSTNRKLIVGTRLLLLV